MSIQKLLKTLHVRENYQYLLNSSLCKKEDFLQIWYKKWCKEIKVSYTHYHRKLWEHVYIIQALHERKLLQHGMKGLGFAVGSEPLPALFAKLGVQILATDIEIKKGQEKGWEVGDQLCYGLESLNKKEILSDKDFKRLVKYIDVDMNNIPEELQGFDFTWSSCAFEHLGSLEKGLNFILNQMKTLKPGGWAVHTSELNISSNDGTIEKEDLVLFRQKDYENVAKALREQGHYVAELDFSLGGGIPEDYFIDVPPYKQDPHLRLQIGQYITTSFGLIIQKKK